MILVILLSGFNIYFHVYLKHIRTLLTSMINPKTSWLAAGHDFSRLFDFHIFQYPMNIKQTWQFSVSLANHKSVYYNFHETHMSHYHPSFYYDGFSQATILTCSFENVSIGILAIHLIVTESPFLFSYQGPSFTTPQCHNSRKHFQKLFSSSKADIFRFQIFFFFFVKARFARLILPFYSRFTPSIIFFADLITYTNTHPNTGSLSHNDGYVISEHNLVLI